MPRLYKKKSEKQTQQAQEPSASAIPFEVSEPAIIADRMLRRSRSSCPECDAFPPVCTQKIRDYIGYRCRTCGHRWSEGGE